MAGSEEPSRLSGSGEPGGAQAVRREAEDADYIKKFVERRKMLGLNTRIEIDGEELNQIFKDIHKAEMTIRECYSRLRDLGVVKIKNSQR